LLLFFFLFIQQKSKSKKLDSNEYISTIPDKSDIYAKRDQNKKVKCGHRGCEKEWNESENTETSCNVKRKEWKKRKYFIISLFFFSL